MPTPADAICQELVWKHPELRRFAVALVRAALALQGEEFTTDIVGDDVRSPGSPGIAGSVVTILQNASVIQPVGITQAGVFYAARVQSTRAGAKSRYVNQYRLVSRDIAAAFLRANRADPVGDDVRSRPPTQIELSSLRKL